MDMDDNAGATGVANGARMPGTTPFWYWTIAVISLIWNSFGSIDYFMTKTRNMNYLTSAMGSADSARAMLAMIDGFPWWATAFWAIGVWGSLVGSLLLLMRSRHAITAFALSLAGAVLSFGYQLTTPLGAQMKTAQGMIMPLVIIVAVIVQWWFARASARRGILR